MSERTSNELPRRTFLKIGAVGAAAAAVGAGRSIVVPKLRQKGLTSSDGLFEATSMAVAESLYEGGVSDQPAESSIRSATSCPSRRRPEQAASCQLRPHKSVSHDLVEA